MHISSPQIPVIFCHYGNSFYLKHSLQTVKLFNPDKRIVLLGDDSNRQVALNAGVEHHPFINYNHTEEIRTFDRVYQHIAGVQHGKPVWTNFVFKRWFYIHGFLQNENIRAFWHFDSDNLILSRLERFEPKFLEFDCTEQCGGSCMNGLVANFRTADQYIKTINKLFQDKEYINQQRSDLRENPNFAFTEMRAYQTFREHSQIHSIRLNTIIDDSSFDDCICRDDGMETYNRPLEARILKKLYTDSHGHIYCRQTETGRLIRMNSLNMSWVPSYLYRLILKQAKKSAPLADQPTRIPNISELEVLDIFDEPLSSIIYTNINELLIWSRRIIVSLKNRILRQ